ncbi:MAG: glycosyltransferase [Maritimibacter sp.]|nr:glycosyltransferase [Maritimibacter sp.]
MTVLAGPAPIRRPKPQILFAHEDWPGQFGGFARWLAQAGWDVWALTGNDGPPAGDGLRRIAYRPHRAPSPQTHPYAQAFDRAALVGQAGARACLAARDDGLAPDVIVSHTGPGAGLFLGEVFPRAAHVAYCEWWYNAPGVDTAYLARLDGTNPATTPEAAILEQCRNQPIAQELLSAGHGLCPTGFQAAQFPPALRAMLRVEHDGVDCARFSPAPPGRTRHAGLAALPQDAPVVTYATRGMEPHRGFPQVMEAFTEVQARHPGAIIVIAGDNGVHYGANAARRIDWKAEALRTHALDPGRTLFTGALDADDYLWLLRRSDAHVYATVPFVLSWSMLDAMAVAAPLVLSDTEPVREFADADCARLADLARPASFAEGILDTLADPDAARARGQRARARILARHDASRIYPAKAAWLEALAAGRRPAPGRRRPDDLAERRVRA